MKLKRFIKELQSLVELHPEALEYDVIYAKDEEGNGFNLVEFHPTIGSFDGERDGDYAAATDLEEGQDLNSVCIN